MSHRERAPQEITPVRIEAAGTPARAVAAVAPEAMALAPQAASGATGAADPAPTVDEITHDVGIVRRRAFATAAYGVGAAALASTVTIGDMRAGPAFAPAVMLTLFCGVATVVGTLWTWVSARRLGDAGISVFDTIDGAWRDLAARNAADGAKHHHIAGRASRALAANAAAGAKGRAHDVHRVPASAAVLGSRWGGAVTKAVEDRAAIAHLVQALGPADRDMIPDVLPTTDMLVGRVGELATTLHELDRDAPPSLVEDVESRLAAARSVAGEKPTSDDARRIELLNRQRETLEDLVRRREQLAARLEGASLLLQNMRLDLLRLRSAGIEAALGELATATREAGALNRDIGRALYVADELRKE